MWSPHLKKDTSVPEMYILGAEIQMSTLILCRRDKQDSVKYLGVLIDKNLVYRVQNYALRRYVLHKTHIEQTHLTVYDLLVPTLIVLGLCVCVCVCVCVMSLHAAKSVDTTKWTY